MSEERETYTAGTPVLQHAQALERECKRLRTELSNIADGAERETRQLRGQIGDLKRVNRALLARIADLERELNDTAGERDDAEAQMERWRAEAERLAKLNDELRATLNAAEAKIDTQCDGAELAGWLGLLDDEAVLQKADGKWRWWPSRAEMDDEPVDEQRELLPLLREMFAPEDDHDDSEF